MTAPPPNIWYSADVPTVTADTVAASKSPPDAAAAANPALDPETDVGSAAAPDLTDPPVAVAEFIEPSITETEVTESAPAASQPKPTAAVATATFYVSPPEFTDISNIPEIFYFVRKLISEPSRFVLDEAAFAEALEEPPLFLRAAGFRR